jgi:hypothetical protein
MDKKYTWTGMDEFRVVIMNIYSIKASSGDTVISTLFKDKERNEFGIIK